MGREVRDRRPNLRPPTRIELKEGNTRLRVILILILIAIAVAAFSSLISTMIKSRQHSGFSEIVSTGESYSVADEFSFFYHLGDKGSNALYRRLSKLYTEATEDAYRIFSSETVFEGTVNLASLNASPGEILTVDPALYKALTQLAAFGERSQYLAPIYEDYRNIFYSDSDYAASYYDIAQNPALAAYYGELAAFARDPESVELELLGEGRVRLSVSEAYLEFAEENGITCFVSFSFMRNAFVADYLAEVFSEAGYTDGYFASFDGFTRNLDSAEGREYVYNLFCRSGNVIDLAARLEYSGPMSIVYLRNYPMSSRDRTLYYVMADGKTFTPYLDTRDGASRVAAENIVVYDASLGTAELLLRLMPLYIADSLDGSALLSLPCESIWCAQGEIRYTDQGISIFDLNEEYRKVHLN